MNDVPLELVAREVCKAHGYTFGRYVNQGTFKETYQVFLPDKSSLALKIFKPGFSPERTAREIDAMQQFDHPNIGRLLAIGMFTSISGEHLISVEEYLGGGTLGDRMNRSLLSRSELVNLGSILIEAVACIASRDLVHRDLKPDNIMFRSDELTPVIVDFGIVRDLQSSSLTRSFLPSGPCTPYFAAPEQLNNTKDLIDWRTDQFALGVLLTIACTNTHPFSQGDDSHLEVCDRVAARSAQSTRFVEWAADMHLPALVRMTDPWPVNRYRTPEALAKAWTSQRGVA